MRTQRLSIGQLAAGAGLLAAACGAMAQGLPTVVSSTFGPSGTSTINVPSVGARTFSSYNGLFRSASGERWIFVGNLTGDSATNRVIVAGNAAVAGQGQVVVRKGGAIPGSVRTMNIVGEPRIDDAGRYAFETNSSGPTGTTPTVFLLTGTSEPSITHTVIAAIGEPVPAVPGSTYSGGFNATLLDNMGRAGFSSSINDGTTTAGAVFFDGMVVARANDSVNAPTLLDGSMSSPWTLFTLNRVFVNEAGTGFFWLGTVNPGAGAIDVAALNNVAVAQEGSALPGGVGGGLGVQSITSVWLEYGGDWFVRGTFDDQFVNDFVIRNGALVAKRYDAVIAGSDLAWDRATSTSTLQGFLFNVGNARGDYVICGNAVDNVTTDRTAVAVLNGQTIVAQRGDLIDLDGDGVSEGYSIRGFKSELGTGSAFLTEGGALWMTIDVSDPDGFDAGDAIVKLQLAVCAADFNGDGNVSVQDIFDFLAAYFSNDPDADVNNSGSVTVQDIFDFLAAYFAGCP